MSLKTKHKMKRMIMAMVLIASVFTAKAQTIDPTFKSKCDAVLNAIENYAFAVQSEPINADFSTVVDLTIIAARDANFQAQWETYKSIAEVERQALPSLCLLTSASNYLFCTTVCHTHNSQCLGGGELACPIPSCSSCSSTYQNSVLNCLGLSFKPKPVPTPNK